MELKLKPTENINVNQQLFKYLQIPSGQRTKFQLEICYDSLKLMKFFAEVEQEMTKQQILTIIQELTLEFYPSQQQLFNVGDLGRKFYIILEGSVLILLPEGQSTVAGTKKSKFAKVLKNDNKKMLASYITKGDSLPDQVFEQREDWEDLNQNPKKKIEHYIVKHHEYETEIKEILKRYKCIIFMKLLHLAYEVYAELVNGDTFGEVAIRSEGIQSSAAICICDTHLLVLSAQSYQNVLKSYHDHIYNDKINFLKNFMLFRNWTQSALHQILYYLKEFTGNRGDMIYSEGELSRFLYFIKEGEVEIFRHVPLQDNESQVNFTQEFNHLKRNHLNTKKKGKSRQRVCTLGSNCLFGDEEIFQKVNRKSSAIISSAYAQIFYIGKKQFFNNLASFLLVREMYQTHLEKVKWRNKIAQNTEESTPYMHEMLTQPNHAITEQDRCFERRQNCQDIKNKQENQKFQKYQKIQRFLNNQLEQNLQPTNKKQISQFKLKSLSEFDLQSIQTLAQQSQAINSPINNPQNQLLNRRPTDLGFVKRACFVETKKHLLKLHHNEIKSAKSNFENLRDILSRQEKQQEESSQKKKNVFQSLNNLVSKIDLPSYKEKRIFITDHQDQQDKIDETIQSSGLKDNPTLPSLNPQQSQSKLAQLSCSSFLLYKGNNTQTDGLISPLRQKKSFNFAKFIETGTKQREIIKKAKITRQIKFKD